jgi:antitoxin component YwqK of YwqJK toxin-antitoxin module
MDDTVLNKPTIMRRIMYQNGQKHGQLIEYSRLNYPYPKIVSNYKNNTYDGEYIRYFEEVGLEKYSIKEKVNYKNGNRSGLEQNYETEFSPADRKNIVFLKNETNWLNDRKHGRYREWGYYVYKLHLIKECYFNNNEYDLSYPIKAWYLENNPKSVITFVKAIRIRDIPIHRRSIVHVKEWHSNGILKFEGDQIIHNTGFTSELVDINFPSIRYHSNGKIDVRKTVVDDYDVESEGKAEETTESDETEDIHVLTLKDNTLIKVEEFYINGMKSYLYYNIWSNSNQWFLRHSTEISWYKNGAYKEITNYYRGVKEGNYVKYDNDGNIIKMGVIDIKGDNHRVI